MKARAALLVVLLIAAMLLAGCQWWDDLLATSAGTTGPGSPQLIIDPGEIKALATQQAGARHLKIQLTHQAP